jgi:hypothetical protein
LFHQHNQFPVDRERNVILRRGKECFRQGVDVNDGVFIAGFAGQGAVEAAKRGLVVED